MDWKPMSASPNIIDFSAMPLGFDPSFSLPHGPALNICVRLQNAILEHRLPPGMKLTEEEVGESFDSSRSIVRTALQALAHTGLVQTRKNRGAYVAKPTVEDAREVFEARALIEPEIAWHAAGKANDKDLKRLEAHIAAEHLALKSNDVGKALAYSGIFHIVIADIAGHSVYSNIVQSLITQSSLIIALYWDHLETACEDHSHNILVDAFRNHDGDAARKIMREHLLDLHAGLNLNEIPDSNKSLAQILAGV